MSGQAELLATLSERLFGVGFALEDIAPGSLLGMDLIMTEGENGLDLAIVKGGDALGQDLKVALLTPTGSDLLNVLFGFDGLRVLAQSFDPSMMEEFFRLAIHKTVALDPRIRKVLGVTMTPATDETARSHRRWSVQAEVQTVLGDIVRLTLGEVAANG